MRWFPEFTASYLKTIHAAATKFGQKVLIDVLQCVTEPVFLIWFYLSKWNFAIFFFFKHDFHQFHPNLTHFYKKNLKKGLCYAFI